jgi:UDPglucose 6-dehydrogenase
VGALCEQINQSTEPPIEANLILHIIGNDERIGRKFLKAGFAFGGGCLPRDLRSLITSCKEVGSNPTIFQATDQINTDRTIAPASVLEPFLGKSRNIAVLGTVYKAGIDDERGSKSIELIEYLKDLGHEVNSFDPNIDQKQSLVEMLKKAEIIVVTTDEQEFSRIGKMLGSNCEVICDFTITPIVDQNLIPSDVKFYSAGIGWKKVQS